MTRESIVVLAAVSAALLAACKSSRPEAEEEQQATPVEAEPPAPTEADLFESPARLPLSSPLVGLLPPETGAVYVLADPERARSWLRASEWSAESREALGAELRERLGLDLLDPASLGAAGIDPTQPMALAQLGDEVFALVVAVVDQSALRKGMKKEKGRRLVLRDRLAAILVGPERGKALATAAAAVEGTANGASLADADSFQETSVALNVGKDLAVYAKGSAPVGDLALGLNLRDRAVMAQVVLHLDQPDADWKPLLVRFLGTSDLKQKPAVASPEIDAIRTVCDAAETMTVNADTVRPRKRASELALQAMQNSGILGALAYGGTSKKAKRKREQLEAAEASLQELEASQAANVTERERELRSALGTAVGYARVDGDKVILYGGQFFARPTGEVASRAAALWHTASSRSEAGAKVAVQQREVDKLRDQLSDISAKELFGSGAFGSLTGTADFSSGLSDVNVYGGLIGDEIGEAQGGFGYGVKGTGPGGGGTGWGTIGTGSYGTIGHGGGTGAGYGRGGGGAGYGRIGGGARPKATLQSGGDEILREYLSRKMSRIQRCYRKALGKDAKLSGTVDVQLQADDAGTITAHATGVSDRTLTNCVAVAAGGKSAGAAGRAGSFSISLDPGK